MAGPDACNLANLTAGLLVPQPAGLYAPTLLSMPACIASPAAAVSDLPHHRSNPHSVWDSSPATLQPNAGLEEVPL